MENPYKLFSRGIRYYLRRQLGPQELEDKLHDKFFTLTKPARPGQVDQCRGPTNKLRFAVQLCMLRWHGYFLPDTRDVPSSFIQMIGSGVVAYADRCLSAELENPVGTSERISVCRFSPYFRSMQQNRDGR